MKPPRVSRPAHLALATLATALIGAPGIALSEHGPVASYKSAPVLGQIGPPNPSPIEPTDLPKPTAADWSCQGGKCSYTKFSGAWSDCFTAWSPTHGGWLPTRYCR